MLTLFVKRKDVEINTKGSINRKLVCKCVAFSANNEKIISKKAVIKTACKFAFFTYLTDKPKFTGKLIHKNKSRNKSGKMIHEGVFRKDTIFRTYIFK